MLKKMIKFLKLNKASHAIEAMFIVPTFLLVILFFVYQNKLYSARQVLSGETAAIANIVSVSDSISDARSFVEDYVKVNELYSEFGSKTNTDSKNYLKFYDLSNNICSEDTKLTSGEKYYIELSMNTSFAGINFTTLTIGDTVLSVFKTSYVTKTLIIINN